jgi:hypothetical protein
MAPAGTTKKGPLPPLVQHLRVICKNLPRTNGQGGLYLLPKDKDGSNVRGKVAAKAKEDSENLLKPKDLERLVRDDFPEYPLYTVPDPAQRALELLSKQDNLTVDEALQQAAACFCTQETRQILRP